MKDTGNRGENIPAKTESDAATTALAQAVAAAVVRAIEEKWGGLFARLESIPRIKTAAERSRRDIGLIMHRMDADAGQSPGGIEACTIKGARRSQFLRMCELKKSDPARTLRNCAKQALAEIRGADGYGDVDALVEYGAIHRSWWETADSRQNAGTGSDTEGGLK